MNLGRHVLTAPNVDRLGKRRPIQIDNHVAALWQFVTTYANMGVMTISCVFDQHLDAR